MYGYVWLCMAMYSLRTQTYFFYVWNRNQLVKINIDKTKVLTLNARRKGSINQLYLMRDKRQTVKPDKRAALKSQIRLMEVKIYERYTIKNSI